MTKKFAPNRILINTAALQDNYRFLQSRLSPGCRAAAVVKANGYGLGVDTVVPALEAAGANFFYVAHFSEALAVRRLTSAPVAVLGGLPKGAAEDYKASRILPVLNSVEEIISCPADLPAIWHLDTGMNRLGLPDYELDAAVASAKALPVLLMTHFTSSDDVTSSHTTEQVTRFDDYIARLPKPFQILPQGISNSSGIFRLTNHRAQARPGIALYGGNPTPETTNPMKEVVRADTEILQIRKVRKGETVGYNCTERTTKDTLLATVGLGYADGFLRSGSSRAKLYRNGHPCKIMGRVSMDTIIVSLENLPDTCPAPRQGDRLEILGEHQSVDALAADLGTIAYEVLTSLSRRAERQTVENFDAAHKKV